METGYLEDEEVAEFLGVGRLRNDAKEFRRMNTILQTPCDAALAESRMAAATSDHPRLVLVTTILASSLAFIDGSVVNVGLPAIGRSLHGDAADLQWAINSYLLPLSALLLFGGALGDRFGRRQVLIWGVALFAMASAACAFAPSLFWLLVGRAVQGGGAALLMPNSLAILGASFSGEAKGRAIGTWAATGAMAGALGPVFGGWLIDTTGWRSIFLINLPLALAGIACAWFFVRDEGDEGPSPLDVSGAFFATIGLGGLTFGLTAGTGGRGWSAAAISALVIGAIFLLLFLWVERRKRDEAMMPLALFASRGFIGITLLTLLLYGALGGFLVLIPYVLIQAEHYSATAAGAALLPFPLVIAAVSRPIGALAGRTGPRAPLIVGTLVVAAGFLLAIRVGSAANYWTTYFPAIITIAVGMAFAVAPLTTAVLTSVDARHTGSASGFNSAVARTGGLVATALLGSVLAASGSDLIVSFRIAVAIFALVSLAAAISALALISPRASTAAASK